MIKVYLKREPFGHIFMLWEKDIITGFKGSWLLNADSDNAAKFRRNTCEIDTLACCAVLKSRKRRILSRHINVLTVGVEQLQPVVNSIACPDTVNFLSPPLRVVHCKKTNFDKKQSISLRRRNSFQNFGI